MSCDAGLRSLCCNDKKCPLCYISRSVVYFYSFISMVQCTQIVRCGTILVDDWRHSYSGRLACSAVCEAGHTWRPLLCRSSAERPVRPRDDCNTRVCTCTHNHHCCHGNTLRHTQLSLINDDDGYRTWSECDAPCVAARGRRWRLWCDVSGLCWLSPPPVCRCTPTNHRPEADNSTTPCMYYSHV